LGAGALAALASVFIPGFGLVLGGGALATAIAGAAGATAAGAVAGGVHGYLMDQGVPDEPAMRYEETFRSGGAILSVNCPSNDVTQSECEGILSKYGATNIGNYGHGAGRLRERNVALAWFELVSGGRSAASA